MLQVLEDLRVPIDCIAGTSIGSIVGGLYATGMSPAAMDSTLSSINWLELFDDRPPRRLVSFRRKAEDYLPYLDFEVGLGKDGLATPAGAVAGPKLLFLLRALTLSSIGTDSFDDLPIPYRAVAADLADGSLVVIDRGTVADAMRASMAIPGAFTPHVVDGRTLVDGGFLRNVPYDVVKAMGADVVIVVDVGGLHSFRPFEPDRPAPCLFEQFVDRVPVPRRAGRIDLDESRPLESERLGNAVTEVHRVGNRGLRDVGIALRHGQQPDSGQGQEESENKWRRCLLHDADTTLFRR